MNTLGDIISARGLILKIIIIKTLDRNVFRKSPVFKKKCYHWHFRYYNVVYRFILLTKSSKQIFLVGYRLGNSHSMISSGVNILVGIIQPLPIPSSIVRIFIFKFYCLFTEGWLMLSTLRLCDILNLVSGIMLLV